MTFAQRKKLANEQLLHAIDATDKDAASTAAIEIINEWLPSDVEMGRRLRERYTELEDLKGKKLGAETTPEPVPITGPDLDHHNPYAKPDPYKLLEWYGHSQFRAVVTRESLRTLGVLVDAVLAREPGATPPSRKPKKPMIDFVVEHVAGPGY